MCVHHILVRIMNVFGNLESEGILESYFKKQVFPSLNMVRHGKLRDKEIIRVWCLPRVASL